MAKKDLKITDEQLLAAVKVHGDNISALARELSVHRSTIQARLIKLGLYVKPLVGGSRHGRQTERGGLPPRGIVKRYIITSAQNNTRVNKRLWASLLALADHYDAQVLVGTYTYNQNAYGSMAVKQGKWKPTETKLWYDSCLLEYISDDRLELAPGLVWCGEMNILPTAVDPLQGMETYTNRKSSIFPHAKQEMRSVATMLDEGAKLMYTTGTVTEKNYIQKREGIRAEEEHRYGALVVEVNHDGNWWVRQIGMGSKETVLQDLDVAIVDGEVEKDKTVEAITWGDLHATWAEPWVLEQSWEMLDVLRPPFQFVHDVLEGVSINRHVIKNGPDPHYAFNRWLRGLHRVDAELSKSAEVLNMYCRPWSKVVVPDSNHDGWWLKSWLSKYDYRWDPANAELFLDLQKWMYAETRFLTDKGESHKEANLTRYALQRFGANLGIQFLLPDESFKICGGKIECGMHGHLGPDGKRGNPGTLKKIGRKANIGHVHSAGIYRGLYVAGVSAKLKWSYNYGPSSWTHSHIVTYPSGQRAIVTMYAGKWRAQEGAD